MTTSNELLAAEDRGARAGARSGPVVIEVRNLNKTFRIPEQRVDTLKERITHPFRQLDFRQMLALKDVSFDVHKGEFFGIVGKNGSGKSTLLKILASIYKADAGRVRMAGRMAPFIELGVGFNPELTARENCALNGVLMGLSAKEARRRLDSVLDFGELWDFADLKVKNYSSGMMVRLAFSLMIQSDPDIMLIDEVLAVGDAAFSQKCMDVFYERKAAGKTIVLVTHDMATVQSMCHRAMVIKEGEVQFVGEPEDAALRYFRLNFDIKAKEGTESAEGGEHEAPPEVAERPAVVQINGRLVHALLRNDAGEPIQNVEQGEPIILDVLIEAARALVDPRISVHIVNKDGLAVFTLEKMMSVTVQPGQKIHLKGRIENLLVPGRYHLDSWIRQDRQIGDMAVQGLRLTQFVVYGTAPQHGIVMLPAELEPSIEP
jgi:ABC-2 type transport system ATP-binding protein